MFSIGIIGLPNAGKSTLFKALTKISVPIADYPFTTIDPHHGIVKVKDERLEKIKEILNPQKAVYPTIEFIDIAGLVKGAHKGEGLGNQFLSNITEADLLLEVVRCFSVDTKEELNEKENPTYNLWEKPSPERDIEIIKNEIIERDKKILKGFIEEKKKILKNKRESGKELILENEIYQLLENKIFPAEKIKEITKEKSEELELVGKKLGLISLKPIIYCFNIKEKTEELIASVKKFSPAIFLNIKEEEAISELNDEEKKELNIKSNLDDLIINCYNTLDLITFYTIKGNKEIRANEIKKGSNILEAAEKIHSDFRERFICAEVLKFEDFLLAKSWQKAKENGLLKTKGKDYIVEDGDIIEFKI